MGRTKQALATGAMAAAFGCVADPSGLSQELAISMNDGAAETRDRTVIVRLTATGATAFRLAETAIETAAFQPFTDSTTWLLSEGDGPRVLYAQVEFTAGARSSVQQDTIVLSEHVYAAASGSDGASGSYLNPKRSVGAALAAAVSEGRERVRLFGGRYSPSTTGDAYPVRVPAGITLEGVLDTGAVLDAQGSAGVLRLENVAGATVRRLELRGGRAVEGGGVYALGSNILLDQVVVRDNLASVGSGVFVGAGAQVALRRSVVAFNLSVEGADAHGVEIRDGGEALLHNNTIAFHDSNGIIVRGSSAVDMRNNIVYANGRTSPDSRGRGICELSSPHRSVLRYNIFWINVIAPVLFGGTGDISANQANALSDFDGIAGNFEADPLFRDAANGDFRLRPGSPAANAGDPNPLFADADGTRNDIGSFGGR